MKDNNIWSWKEEVQKAFNLKSFKTTDINSVKIAREVYESRHFLPDQINNLIQNLCSFLTKNQWHQQDFNNKLIFNNLVEHCYQLFLNNLPSFKNELGLKPVIIYLTAEYIKTENVKIGKVDQLVYLRDLAELIFDNQIIPLIVSLETKDQLDLVAEDKKHIKERIKISDREKEYLQKRGANLDFTRVLAEAQKSVIKEDKASYKKDITLSEDGGYSLPVIKCLISFEDEDRFVERLEGDPVLQEFLVEYRDHIDRTLLHYAAAKGKSKVLEALCSIPKVKELINKGDGYGRTALHIASGEGNIDLIQQLLESGANPSSIDGYHRTALHIAVINNQVSAIEKLTKRGLFLDAKDNFGRTPLHLAALFNNSESVVKLLELGANLNELDTLDRTPLYLAIKEDAVQTVKELGKKDKFNKSLDKHENTALHIAVIHNSIETLKFLCSKLDLDVKNKHKSTPLHNAAYVGNLEAIDILLEAGANVTAMDDDKRVPLQLAIKRNDNLINTIGNEAAAEKKIQAAIKCCDSALLTRKVWSKYQIDDSTLYRIKQIKQFCEIDEYKNLDSKVKEFILRFIPKVLKFFDGNAQELCSVLDKSQENNEPLIIKIAKSGNVTLFKKYVSDLPEFKDILDQEQKDNLLKILNSINLEEKKSNFYGECYSGNLEGVKSLIDENKGFPDFTNAVNSVETLFYIINGNGSSKDKENIMYYLKKENLLNLNINNGYALEMAVQKDDISLVQFLMDNEVKMNSYDDGILLYYAAQKNDYDMFFFLKNSGINLDSELLGNIKELELGGDMKVAIDHLVS